MGNEIRKEKKILKKIEEIYKIILKRRKWKEVGVVWNMKEYAKLIKEVIIEEKKEKIDKWRKNLKK